ncbi:MAG: isochorismatase family protein [Verrucomicrobiota bacterium]
MESLEIEEFANDLVLMVVDMQASLLKTVDPQGSLLKRTEFAVRVAKLIGIRIVFTEQVPEKLGPTVPSLVEAAGGPEKVLVFPKSAFNALNAPGIDRVFADMSESHILLAGIETPICIYQTALDGLSRDIQITLLSDCLGARRDDDVAPVMRVFAGAGGTILPSETVFYSILNDAGHPQFRAFTQLVKHYS